MPRALRPTVGVKLGRRAYNKIFRLMVRLESEVEELERQYEVFRLTRLAKTSFAADIPRDAFVASQDSAAFVAYMTATLGRRSQFTNGSQTRAFDDVAAALLKRCERSTTTNWFAVAHVFPRADILARLTESERFALLGRALDALQRSAHLQRWLYERSATVFNLDTMVVRRGMDSTTWNSIAGGWNRARDFWLALAESLGMEDTFDTFMPGKVLRLMAADVMVWHRASGGEKHGDTGVWSLLPKPWEVVLDRADGIAAPEDLGCGRADIEHACRAAGVDGEATGWTRARARTAVAAMQFTPELVQGVTVSNPELAAWLRRIGAWRGNTPLRTARSEARA